MRNRFTLLFAALLIVLLGAGSVMAQTTYYVDPTGTDDPAYGSGTGTSAFKTITYAIGQASSTVTDVIVVAAGTYSEYPVLGKSVTILGPNASIAGNGTRNSEAVLEGNFLVNADNVTIKGVFIDGTNVSQSTNLTMRGILIGNVASQSNAVIENNIIKNWVTGISLAGGSSFPWNEDILIKANKFINNGIGSTENVDGLTIINNVFDNGGIGLGSGCVLAAPITGNDFSNGSRYISVASGVSLVFASLLLDNTFDLAVACDDATGSWYAQAIFSSITSAAAAAASGTTLTVASGTYSESPTIGTPLTMTSTVTSGSSTGAPVLNGMLTVTADNVTIKALKITNPAGSNGIVSNGNSYLTVTDNLFDDIGSASTSGYTHALVITVGSANITDIQITDNVFTGIHGGEDPTATAALQKANNGSASAISIGWSNAAYNVLNLLVEGNTISDVNACTNDWNSGGKGTYGVLINVGSGGAGGNTPGAQIKNNSIADLEGLWAHAIGLEGDTPNAVVQGNDISDLTDYKTPSDAIGVLFEKNPNAHTVTIEDNQFGANLPFGVALHPDYFDPAKNTSTAFWYLDLSLYDVDATSNFWNDATGPVHTTNTTGTGTPVGDEVNYSPWLAAVPASSPMTWGTNDNIGNAITAAVAGDFINVAPGTYSENVIVNKKLTIIGSVSGGTPTTTVSSTTGSVIAVQASGTSTSDPVLLQNLNIQVGGAYGINIGDGTSYLEMDNLKVSGSPVYNGVGIKLASQASADHITIRNSTFSQMQQGLYTDKDASNPTPLSSLTAVLIEDSEFSDNEVKGLYFEKLSDAQFTRVTISGNGFKTGYNFGQGLDINLKYGAYSNIVLTDLVVSGNGGAGTSGAGVNIKARGTGNDSYATNPATLSNVQVVGGLFTGNSTAGLRFGEPGKGNTTPTNVVVSGASFDGNSSYGLENVTTASVDAKNNWWGDNSGPYHATTNASALGDAVTDNVTYTPWITQANVSVVGTYAFDGNGDATDDIEMSFTTVPAGGGTVSVNYYTSATAGAPALPGNASSALYLDVSSDMENYQFEVTITLNLTAMGITTFDANTAVLYYNETTAQWLPISGIYSAGPPATYAFTTNHFTFYSFPSGTQALLGYHNTQATAYNLYVTTDPSNPTSGAIYPNDNWDLPASLPAGYPGDVNDWGYTGTQAVSLYVVPSTSAEFGSADLVLQWTDGMLGAASADFEDGIFDADRWTSVPNFGTVTGAISSTLGYSDAIELNAAMANENFDNTKLVNGDYIAKLNFSLLKPGSSQIDFIGLDLRYFETSAQAYVWTIGTQAEIKAYLGDVASSSSEATGDGAININDLTPWALSYWSGVPGGTGMTNYKVKYDIGPTSTNYVDGIPDVDGKIDFEDLMIFSVNYGLSANNSLPRSAPPAETITINVTDATTADGITTVTLGCGTDPVDLKGLSLVLNGHFGSLLSAEYAGSAHDVVIFHRQEGNMVMVDLAALGAVNSISRSGALLTLRFAGDAEVAQVSGLARDSHNNPIQVGRVMTPVAGSIALDQNYPNPFNPVTNITYTVTESMPVRLDIYNVLGTRIATLTNGVVDAGTHTVQWNGRSDNGQQQPSGMYIYRLSAGETVMQRTMVLSK